MQYETNDNSCIRSVKLKNTFFFLNYAVKNLFYFLFSFWLIPNIGQSQIVINEVGIAPSAAPAGFSNEFIELFNKSSCVIDISCYTLVYSSTTGGGNPSGWTIKIPTGSSISACGYFLIGGIAGQAGVSASGTGYPTGGTPTPYNGFANFDVGTPGATANAVYMLQGVNAGSLPNTQGQIILINGTGVTVSSVSYNNGIVSGNNPGSYPLSAYITCNNSGNTQGFGNVPNPGNSVNHINSTFSAATRQGIYLDASGIYQTETSLTPGTSNTANGGSQLSCDAPLIVTAFSNSPICEDSTLNLSSIPSGGSSSYTYNWSGPNGFTSFLQNPSIANVTIAASGIYTIIVTDTHGCTATTTINVTINSKPPPITITHN